jgi:hypothetical protein
MKIARITRKGQAALRNDRAQGTVLLITELASRTGPIERDHLADLVTELLDHFGSPEAAVTALRAGLVNLEKL